MRVHIRTLGVGVLAVVLSLVAAPVHAADGPAPNPVDVDVTGIVKDYNGKPVKEGFVMLQGSPRLCASTDGLGQFRITGKAWELPDTLLASWAGCEIAEIPIAKAETKDLAIRLKAEDREFTKIEVGGAITITRKAAPQKLSPGVAARQLRLRPLTKDQQTCVTAYQAFLKSRGEAIIRKMLDGAELSADEAKYQYLLSAEISCRAGHNVFARKEQAGDTGENWEYCFQVIQRAKRALAKGYLREQLTQEEIYALRVYRAVQAVHHPAGKDDLPAAGLPYYNPRRKAMNPKGLELGDLHPDSCLLRLDPLFKSPGYSNYSSLSLTEFVRLESLAYLLRSFESFDLDAGGRLGPRAKEYLTKTYPRDCEQLVSLSEIAFSEKPTFLFWYIFEDRTYPVGNSRFMQYLRGAYRGQAQVISVHKISPWWGDMTIDEFRYYGPNPDAAPLLGRDCRLGEEDITPERHARIVKVACMENPLISGPMFLELAGSPFGFSSPARDGRSTLIDRNGRISVGPRKNLWTVGGGWWEKTTFAYDYFHPFWLFAPHEKDLRALISNRGEYHANINGKWFLPTYPKLQFNKHDTFKITSIDKKASTIHAGWIKPIHRGCYGGPGLGAPTGEFHFRLQSDTRIVLRTSNGKLAPIINPKGPFAYRLATMDDLSVGDVFYADFAIDEKQQTPQKRMNDKIDRKTDRLRGFDMAKYENKILDTARIQNFYPNLLGPKSISESVPFYGHVTGEKGNIITVEMPEEDVAGMHGLKFWEEDKDLASVDRTEATEPRAKLALSYMRRWRDGGKAGRTCGFAVDRSVRICRNGEVEKTVTDLKVGDYVWVTYQMWFETQHQSQCLIYPETIMASSPMGGEAQ